MKYRSILTGGTGKTTSEGTEVGVSMECLSTSDELRWGREELDERGEQCQAEKV